MLNLLVLVLCVGSVLGQTGEADFTISLFATDLFDCDALSACDTQVTIFCATGSDPWTQCGQTKVLTDDAYPIFPERFTFHYIPNQGQKWRFDLVDKDVQFDDFIGSVSTEVGAFLDSTTNGNSIRLTIPNNRGFFHVKRET